MSDTEDIFAVNSSDESDYASVRNSVSDQGSIVIEETEDEDEDETKFDESNDATEVEEQEISREGQHDHADDESERNNSEEREVLERMKKRQSRRISFHPNRASSSGTADSSDEEFEMVVKPGPIKVSVNVNGNIEGNYSTSEEEQSMEERALSPRTRMSMTGVRPEDLTSDSEDEEEVVVTRKMKRNVIHSDSDSESEKVSEAASKSVEQDATPSILISDESHASKESVPIPESAEGNQDSFEGSLSMHSFNAEGDNRDSIATKLSSTAVSEDNKGELSRSSLGGRPSFSVRQSIGDKLSSTLLEVVNQQPKMKSNDTSSIALIEKTAEIVSVSSDEEQPSKPMVQPTIRAAFNKQFVSQSFHDSKQRELADKQKALATMEKLMQMKNELPDKGAALMNKIAKVCQEIQALSKELNGMEVQKSKGIRDEIRKSFESSTVSITSDNGTLDSVNEGKVNNYSWQDIQKATDLIQPKYTGKQGMATFETQKTLTLDRLATLHKSIETCPSEDTLAEPPKLLKISLMNHQLHALAWMMWRESQKPRGGILADDMGLGKTLSMIALILKAAELDDPDKELEESDDSEKENEQTASGWKAKGRKDYYAGGTLVVCPASLMRQWEGEITSRVTRNSLAVNVYHGPNRDAKPRHLAKYDVVITTYAIVSREAKSDRSGLFGVKWERVILDEAHTIRNHKAALSVACCQLKGHFRWVLTGTPIQNKEMDIYALLKFLRCTPFDDFNHWKKWIDNKTAGGMVRLNTIMKSIMLRRTKQQLNEKGALQCLPTKNIELIEVKLVKDEMNVYQRVLLYSRSLFAQFLHQRAEKENATYFGSQASRPTFAQSRQPNGAFDKVHQRLKQLHTKDEVKQHQILLLLLRLRQICCHPGLIQKMLDDDDGNFDVSSIEEEEVPELDLLAQLNKLKLTDTPGQDSSTGALRELNVSDQMPENAEAISKASSKVMLRSNPVFNLDRVSSKINAVLDLLESKVLNTDDKAVVVSQWTSMLEIVADHLRIKGVKITALTGQVPVKLRNDIVVEFNKQGCGPKIMLLSLTAGGVGLNLVGANHLLLLDLHWNPQLEAQAQDRVYRVGQQKPVFIWKFMCSDTIEQAIMVLQQKKLDIADSALTGAKHTGSKLSIDDLKSLFGL